MCGQNVRRFSVRDGMKRLFPNTCECSHGARVVFHKGVQTGTTMLCVFSQSKCPFSQPWFPGGQSGTTVSGGNALEHGERRAQRMNFGRGGTEKLSAVGGVA
jgi:hypothetical protein